MAREAVLVLVVTFAYFLTRGLIRGRADAAFAHAAALLRAEHALHLAPERRVQALILPHRWLVHATNGVYEYGHLPVLVAVAVWLYGKRPAAYPTYRLAFLLTALLGLSIYVLYPVAPPRFLPGFVDTMQRYSFNVDGSAFGPFYNPYAAMPSLHVAWALLIGIALVRCAASRCGKGFGLLLPPAMILAVIGTGNHYLLDVIAGILTTLIAVVLATCVARHTRPRASPLPPVTPVREHRKRRGRNS